MIRTVNLSDVVIQDEFFLHYANLVRKEVLPYQWAALNDAIPGADPSGCIQNFRIAAHRQQGNFVGMVFQDSDLAKWLEAAAYSLTAFFDPELQKQIEACIDLLEQAQGKDGYLNTYFTLKEPENRWKNIRDCHELYCAGHMLEAAVAYYCATGKDRFLQIMCRYVDYIGTVFGKKPGQIQGYPGHEELELALCKLFDVTGESRYLQLAKYFIDERGQQPSFFVKELQTRGDTFHWEGNDTYGLQYFQAHLPVRQQRDAVGHAVRAVYLYSGMADVALRTDDEALRQSCCALAESIMRRQMYVTGAIGSTLHGEAFTFDYDLPSETAYAETCASVGLVFFMKRMLLLEQEARYADVMERALYNTVLAGMGLDGKSFFYANPQCVYPKANEKNPSRWHVKTRRQKWFACACCPPNVARLLADIGEYIYQLQNNSVTVNLFIGSELKGEGFVLRQSSALPYGGNLRLTAEGEAAGQLCLWVRKPYWTTEIRCNQPYTEEKGYLVFAPGAAQGGGIEIEFALPVRRVYGHPLLRDAAGKVAVMRGPLVYCLEQADNGENLHLITLPRDATFAEQPGQGVLRNTMLLTAIGQKEAAGGSLLYSYGQKETLQPWPLTFVPYYTWANRQEGEMTVWVRE